MSDNPIAGVVAALASCLEPHTTLVTWREDLANPERPLLLSQSLPYGRVRWYILARTERQFRAMREELTAFVGSSYAWFSGQRADLRLDDPLEATLLSLINGPSPSFVAAYTLTTSREQSATRSALVRLRNLLVQRPKPTETMPRPTGRVLREFEFALQGKNWAACESCLNELRVGGRLDETNLARLKVRYLAEGERWTEVVALPETADLVARRQPPLVRAALLRAVYQSRLRHYELTNDAAGAVAHYRSVLCSELGPLFAERGRTTDPTLSKALAVARVADGSTDADAFLATLPSESTARPWIAALFALRPASLRTPTQPESNPLDHARSLFDNGQYAAALDLLVPLPPTVMGVRLLVSCAVELDDQLAGARFATETIEKLPPDLFEEVLRSRQIRRAWEELSALVATPPAVPTPQAIPRDWSECVALLATSGHGIPLDALRSGCRTWQLRPFLDAPDLVQRMAKVLVSPPDETTHTTLRGALPDLLAAFLREEQVERSYKPIYLALMDLLVLDDGLDAGDLPTIRRLTEVVLECGLNTSGHPSELSELIERLDVVWRQLAAPGRLDWALEVMELLADHAAQRYADVDPLLSRIAADVATWQRRVRPEQWLVFEAISDALERRSLFASAVPQPSATADSEPSGPSLEGQVVAVYTLNERVSNQVKQLLVRAYPGVRVEVCNDDVSTDRLRRLSRQADVFIVNTWDATHQATGAIKSNRGASLPIVYPRSKTVTSILSAFAEWVQDPARVCNRASSC